MNKTDVAKREIIKKVANALIKGNFNCVDNNTILTVNGNYEIKITRKYISNYPGLKSINKCKEDIEDNGKREIVNRLRRCFYGSLPDGTNIIIKYDGDYYRINVNIMK